MAGRQGACAVYSAKIRYSRRCDRIYYPTEKYVNKEQDTVTVETNISLRCKNIIVLSISFINFSVAVFLDHFKIKILNLTYKICFFEYISNMSTCYNSE